MTEIKKTDILKARLFAYKIALRLGVIMRQFFILHYILRHLHNLHTSSRETKLDDK